MEIEINRIFFEEIQDF